MHAVGCELAARLLLKQFSGRREHVDNRQLTLLANSFDRIGVGGQVAVVERTIRLQWIAAGFKRNWSDQSELDRSSISGKLLRQPIQVSVVVRLEFRDLFRVVSGERFVHAEEAQERLRCEDLERIVDDGVVAGALLLGNFIGRPTKVANDQRIVAGSQMQHGFQVPVQAHPLRRSIADQRQTSFGRQLGRVHGRDIRAGQRQRKRDKTQ